MGHLGGVDGGGHDVAHEEELGIRVVHDVVHLVGHELVQDGHGHGAVGERGQEGACPVGAVASAEGYLVALFYAAVLEENVQFLYLACHVVILQGGSLEVGQRVKVPVVYDAFLDDGIKAWYFHSLIVSVLF